MMDLIFFWPSFWLTVIQQPIIVEMSGMRNLVNILNDKVREIDKRLINYGI